MLKYTTKGIIVKTWNESAMLTSYYILPENSSGWISLNFFAPSALPVCSNRLQYIGRFKQISLAPGEKKTVTFTITKDMLMFYNHKLEYVFEPREFAIMVGPNSVDPAKEIVTIL